MIPLKPDPKTAEDMDLVASAIIAVEESQLLTKSILQKTGLEIFANFKKEWAGKLKDQQEVTRYINSPNNRLHNVRRNMPRVTSILFEGTKIYASSSTKIWSSKAWMDLLFIVEEAPYQPVVQSIKGPEIAKPYDHDNHSNCGEMMTN